MTAGRARQLLGLQAGADAAVLARAFRTAVKAVHPDRPGGDAERLREVIEAHRLLSSLSSTDMHFVPATRAGRKRPPPRSQRLDVSVCEALFGGERRIDVGEGRFLDVRLPPGLRAGETLRLAGAGPDGADVLMQVTMAGEPGLAVRGHDVWLDVAVDHQLMAAGSPLEADTPRGRRTFQAPTAGDKSGLVRLRGEGLPARGAHPPGDLVLRITTGSAEEPLAKRLLRRFSARWAA
jgi:curved DNA-binding protein